MICLSTNYPRLWELITEQFYDYVTGRKDETYELTIYTEAKPKAARDCVQDSWKEQAKGQGATH